MPQDFPHDPGLVYGGHDPGSAVAGEETPEASPRAGWRRHRGLVLTLACVAALSAVGAVVAGIVLFGGDRNPATAGDPPGSGPVTAAASPDAPPPDAPGADANSTVIGTYGLGPYQLGASAEDLVQSGDLAAVQESTCGAPTVIHKPRGAYSPESVSVEVSEGKVVEVKVTSPTYRTPSGVMVGTPEP